MKNNGNGVLEKQLRGLGPGDSTVDLRFQCQYFQVMCRHGRILPQVEAECYEIIFDDGLI